MKNGKPYKNWEYAIINLEVPESVFQIVLSFFPHSRNKQKPQMSILHYRDSFFYANIILSWISSKYQDIFPRIITICGKSPK